MKVYSGRGDDGSTGLLYGGRVAKSSKAVGAYGAVDEAVAALGLARTEAEGEVARVLLQIQRDLFVVGAELATSAENRSKLTDGETRVDARMSEALKKLVDEFEARLPELTEFVIPGVNRLSATLDYARTVVRRAERECVAVAQAGDLDNALLLQYLNRLGDLVFLLARATGPDADRLHP